MKERRNLFPNPRFSLNGTLPAWNAASMGHSDLNGTPRLVALYQSSSSILLMWRVKLDPGAYHFQVVTWHEKPCAGCRAWTSADGNNGVTSVLDDGVKDARPAVLQSCDFTVTADNPWVMIGFSTPEPGDSSNSMYWHPLLEAKSTYDAAVNAGGGVFPCTSITGRSRSKRSGVVA